MADDENEGLTRPLINNIGGVIDQDAPSADQLTEGREEDVLDNSGVVEGGRVPHVDTTFDRDVDNVLVNPTGTFDRQPDGPRINPD